ncbi:MAG: hypothetical protein KDK71_01315 [Chlamydiia bacterium]|nr:hypothetical protein [Chlamydiia bacterium]
MVRIGIVILCFWTSLFGAGPMTHLYLAEEFCNALRYGEEETKQFLIGTSLPDIRYLTHCPRENTHFPVTSLKEVIECPSPFLAGMKFHAWVDEEREAFVLASGIYKKIALYTNVKRETFLKFLEEEIIDYDGRKWGDLFGAPIKEEETYAHYEQIAKWHFFVWGSMQARPSWLLWGASWIRREIFGISNQIVYLWSYHFATLAKEPEFRGYVDDLLTHLLQKIETASLNGGT